jgi:hypothetical protein
MNRLLGRKRELSFIRAITFRIGAQIQRQTIFGPNGCAAALHRSRVHDAGLLDRGKRALPSLNF